MTWSILIVDDEPMTRDLLRLMLKGVDCHISEAGNGRIALDKIAIKIPDVIILDVMMPEMDGVTVCEILRGDSKTAALPIIMLSAKIDPAAIEAGRQAGATKYLTKPISRKHLIETLTEVLGKPTSVAP